MAKKTEVKNSAKPKSEAQSSKDEQIGFHKGSLMTLAKERSELVRIVGIVEQLMQMHAAALQELGIKLDDQLSASLAVQPQAPQPVAKKKPPIEDIL